jgi:hypothetical protein
LAFKAQDKFTDGLLSREEFCRFYKVADLKWEPQIKKSGFEKRWALLDGTYANFLNRIIEKGIFEQHGLDRDGGSRIWVWRI